MKHWRKVALILIMIMLLQLIGPTVALFNKCGSKAETISFGVKAERNPIIHYLPEAEYEIPSGIRFVRGIQIGNLTLDISLENTTFYPGITRNLTVSIKNLGTTEDGPFGLYIKTPYFLQRQ